MMGSNYVLEYKVGLDDAKNHGWVSASRDFSSVRKYYKTQPEAEARAKSFAQSTNARTRVRRTPDNKIVMTYAPKY